MTTKAVTDVFDKAPPGAYDEKNKKLAAISENLHFLNRLVLQELPANARVLCVGVGTGADILGLAHAYPGWSFDGIEPSSTMIEDCRKRVEAEGISSRCRLFHGYLSDFPKQEKYDAVLCLLVMHFIQDWGERAKMFKEMAGFLKPNGLLINAEIAYDLESPEFPDILEKWKQVQLLMGGSLENLAQLPKLFREQLLVLPPSKTEELMKSAGLPQPIQFFQAVLIHAWYARK